MSVPTDVDYRSLVLDEATGQAPDATATLGEDLVRWRLALADLMDEQSDQLRVLKVAWEQYRIELRGPGEFHRATAAYETSKAKVHGVQQRISSRLRYVNSLCDRDTGGVNHWASLVGWLVEDSTEDEWQTMLDEVPDKLRDVLEAADKRFGRGR